MVGTMGPIMDGTMEETTMTGIMVITDQIQTTMEAVTMDGTMEELTMTGTMAMADQILTIMEDGIVEAAMMDGIMEEVTRDLNLMDQMLA